MQLQESHCVTIAISCAMVGLSRSTNDDQPKLADNALKISELSAINDKH
jgi:putative transposase